MFLILLWAVLMPPAKKPVPPPPVVGLLPGEVPADVSSDPRPKK